MGNTTSDCQELASRRHLRFFLRERQLSIPSGGLARGISHRRIIGKLYDREQAATRPVMVLTE